MTEFSTPRGKVRVIRGQVFAEHVNEFGQRSFVYERELRRPRGMSPAQALAQARAEDEYESDVARWGASEY